MYPGNHARTTPDKPAVVMADSGETLTYAELEDRSIRLAHVLRGEGLERGGHVALIASNGPDVFVSYWAAVRSGLYITAVNHHLSVPEAAYIVDDCGAEVLIVSADQAELATGLVEQTPNVRRRLAYGGAVAGYDSYEDAVAAASAQEPADQPAGADMLYSSGTTGRPKGIQPTLVDRQVHEPGEQFVAVFGPLFGFDENTVYYSPAPTYHAAPLRFGGMVLATGGTLVMTAGFDAEQALGVISRHGVTHSQWVPTMFVRMLKLDESVRRAHDVSSMKIAIHAAAPCPVDVKQTMMDWWGPVLWEYYSSTEANGITLISPQEWLDHPGSVGQAKLGVIHICDPDDEDGRELATGEIGTIFFERPERPFEYHHDPDKTREAQHPRHENWTTTGDVGYVDEDGFLYLTDRKAFMIISGGVNIYPQEIENCLTMHPAVYDVAVIGVPDREMGEQVKAVVQLAAGHQGTDELAGELIEHVKATIARYKAPRTVDFTDALPRTATGKLVKGELRKQYTQTAGV
ncbi:acyl-CoA synthetase [Actinomycetospora endophytica]|uniref:Acyl-CoA synthetase n=1 Tax=Actinomycetospora endophytica TaxID=2291215 RepID=A0ABS8P678_9PSEU|nr:acyl-CoA synthetase [Actinomycetospora endophytica]MCD2193763.1 acyl-CoA synthetase [Actinomycetospora endophytica]